MRVSKGGQHQDWFPPFETHRFAMLLRVRWCWVCLLHDAPLEWRAPSNDQFAVMPPSMTSSLPVTHDDSSEARYRQPAAMS